MPEKKICFVIAPIGKENTEIRERSDIVFDYIIEPAVTPFGYEPQRADIPPEPGMITPQIVKHIKNDPLVIADLTGGNPNVFYELCLRHVTKKPCIHIIKKGDDIPFDVSPLRIIFVDHTHMPTVKKVQEEIGKQIEEIQKDTFKMESPISLSVSLTALEESGDDTARAYVAIIEMLHSLKRDVAKIETSLHDTSVAEKTPEFTNIFKPFMAPQKGIGALSTLGALLAEGAKPKTPNDALIESILKELDKRKTLLDISKKKKK